MLQRPSEALTMIAGVLLYIRLTHKDWERWQFFQKPESQHKVIKHKKRQETCLK